MTKQTKGEVPYLSPTLSSLTYLYQAFLGERKCPGVPPDLDSAPVTPTYRGVWNQAGILYMGISIPKSHLKTVIGWRSNCTSHPVTFVTAKLLVPHPVAANYCISALKIHSFKFFISPFSWKLKSLSSPWKHRGNQDRKGAGRERDPEAEKKCYKILAAEVFVSQFCGFKGTTTVNTCEKAKLLLLWSCMAFAFPSLPLVHHIKGLRFIKKY